MLTPGWIEDEAWEAVTDQCPHISPEMAPDIVVVRFRAFSPPGLRQLSMDGVGGRIVGGMRPHRVLVRVSPLAVLDTTSKRKGGGTG
jgi:hypothetical protein